MSKKYKIINILTNIFIALSIPISYVITVVSLFITTVVRDYLDDKTIIGLVVFGFLNSYIVNIAPYIIPTIISLFNGKKYFLRKLKLSLIINTIMTIILVIIFTSNNLIN